MLEIEKDLIELLKKYNMDVKEISILFSNHKNKRNVLEIVFEDI